MFSSVCIIRRPHGWEITPEQEANMVPDRDDEGVDVAIVARLGFVYHEGEDPCQEVSECIS